MIIAVDFDGILAKCDAIFPDIGSPCNEMIQLVKSLYAAGHEVILWTSRTDQALSNALTWCFYHGIEFHAINDNAPSNKQTYEAIYPSGTRKVYADIYIDDHNPEFIWYKKVYGYDMAIHNIIKKVEEITKPWAKVN